MGTKYNEEDFPKYVFIQSPKMPPNFAESMNEIKEEVEGVPWVKLVVVYKKVRIFSEKGNEKKYTMDSITEDLLGR